MKGLQLLAVLGLLLLATTVPLTKAQDCNGLSQAGGSCTSDSGCCQGDEPLCCAGVPADGADGEGTCTAYTADNEADVCANSPGIGQPIVETLSADSIAAAQTGDPQIAGFDGVSFEFPGIVGQTFCMLSEYDHLINTFLVEANMWDHNGTYVAAIGFKYKNSAVTVSVAEDGSLSVVIDGKELVMDPGQYDRKETIEAEDLLPGEFMLTWDLFRKNYGHSVELKTPMLTFLIWSAVPGPDQGGVWQQSYLNFQTAMLRPPRSDMGGVVGETFHKLVADAHDTPLLRASSAQHFWVGQGEMTDYIVSNLLASDFKFNTYNIGLTAATKSHWDRVATSIGQRPTSRRLLDPSSSLSFPLVATVKNHAYASR